jgi:hypothetical protein
VGWAAWNLNPAIGNDRGYRVVRITSCGHGAQRAAPLHYDVVVGWVGLHLNPHPPKTRRVRRPRAERRGRTARLGRTRLTLAFGGVVAFAGQDFIVVLGDVDFDFAEFAVAGIVGGVVAQGVLAAKFFGDLIESFLKVLFVVGDNQAAACFFRHLSRDAGVAAEA